MPYYRTRDNQQLYVRIIGRGKPVVLLHGFATHSGPWLPYVLPHSLKYKFYLPDFRCFGKSQDAQLVGDCPLTNFADDLTDMLYNFDISTFKLGGISMGAYASLKYFQKYGQSRVSHYIHMDQSPQVLNNNSWRFGI